MNVSLAEGGCPHHLVTFRATDLLVTSAAMTTGKSITELTTLALDALRKEPNCEGSAYTDFPTCKTVEILRVAARVSAPQSGVPWLSEGTRSMLKVQASHSAFAFSRSIFLLFSKSKLLPFTQQKSV